MKNYYSLLYLLIFLISCTPINNPTTSITVETEDFTLTTPENPAADKLLGLVKGSASSGAVTFKIHTENPSGAFKIGDNSGELFVANATLFDFEKRTSLTAVIKVTSKTSTTIEKEANVTITLTDVSETQTNPTTNPNFTTWTGAKITFRKTDNADPTVVTNQDKITDRVWITRGITGKQIYNIKTETSADKSTSPHGTKWSFGSLATTTDLSTLTFVNFRDLGKPKTLVNKAMILKLTEENIYIDIKITAWSEDKRNKGGFTYERSTAN